MNTIRDLLHKPVRAVLAVAMLTVLAGCTSTTGTKPPAPDQSNANSQVVNIAERTPESETRKRARLRMELAVGYYQEGKYNISLDELKQALTIDPNYPEALGVLALVYMGLGEKSLAEQSFQRALQLSPNDSDVNNNYGWYLCQNGREAQSIAYFMTALKNPLYTQKARPLQNAGVCTLRMGDKARAEDYFRQSFEMDPSGGVSAFNLAQLFYERNEIDRARFYATLVNRSENVTPQSLWLGVRIERKLGNRSEQASLAAQLERSYPNSREAQALSRGAFSE